MGAAKQTPGTRKIVEKLAAEYKVGISRYYDEVDVDGGYSAPVLSLIHIFTIIGIPWGRQHFKLVELSLMPFGKRIVAAD